MAGTKHYRGRGFGDGVQTADFEAFTEMALFLADRGDGNIEDDELRVMVGSLASVAGEYGMDAERAVDLANATAQNYLASGRNNSLEGMTERFHARCLSLADSHDDLPRLYRELVQVAASDGEMETGEEQILHHVRALWRLDS